MNCDSLFSFGSQHASREQNRCRLAGVVIQSVEVTPSLTQCRHPAGDNVDRLGGGPGGWKEEEELALSPPPLSLDILCNQDLKS